ncbi:hypothetical protein B5X24_HaOG209346 [Helicoverpa armigera]|nr:hypothetical protein B5X24_HaOG209346 [Helicoverpa armigera]
MSSSAVSEPIAEKIPTTPARETARPAGRSAMKLGSRGTDAESFVSRLRSEGEAVPAPAPLRHDTPKPKPTDHKESGNTQVVVHQWEGSYSQKGRTLLWTIPIINKQQKSASLEFTVTPAVPNDFFPLTVTWTSDTSLALLKATKVTHAEDNSPVDYSQEISFHPDKTLSYV